MVPESNECAPWRQKRTHTYTNEIPCEDTIGRVWGYAATSQGTLGAARAGGGKKGSCPGTVRGSMPLMTPYFRLLPTGCGTINFSCFKPQCCGNLLW